jgi:hypothetical protein
MEIESYPKLCIFKYKQDGVLDKNRTMDNAQKHNICTEASNFDDHDIKQKPSYDIIVPAVVFLCTTMADRNEDHDGIRIRITSRTSSYHSTKKWVSTLLLSSTLRISCVLCGLLL